MQHHTPESSHPGEDEESLMLLYLCLSGFFVYILWLRRDRANYRNIPAVGLSGSFSSFISVLRWLNDPAGVVQKGYLKFSGGIFRYPALEGWVVVVGKPKYIEELRKAPEDEVSASEAMADALGMPYTTTLGPIADQELKSLLGAQLTRNLPEFIPDIHHLISGLLTELVLPGEDDWNYFDEVKIMTRICVQAVNQILVGPRLSQNSEFIEHLIFFSGNLERYAKNLKRFPKFLRQVYILFTPLPRIKRQLRALLADALNKRQGLLVNHVNREDMIANNMIAWLANHDTESEMSMDDLVAHVLLVNYFAVQPMIHVMCQALRNLAVHPDYIKLLRREVEEATRQERWTKAAVDEMRKVDAFLKETMRTNTRALSPCPPGLTMARKCRRPLTFSDGTTVPQNALLFVSSQLLHTDKQYYSRPEMFDPLRFTPSTMDSGSSQSSSTVSSSTLTSMHPVSLTLPATSATFLAWGHGKHACPGRFFAASVMKLMLARFVLEFDFRPPSCSRDDADDGKQWVSKGADKLPWIEMRKCRRRPSVGI